ncbi:MAG TPA: hypothetical protein VF695_00155 [Sphingomonas sp.]|jgi:hypothetical protein
MTDIGLPLWLAATFTLPWVLEAMRAPARLQAFTLIIVLLVGLICWWYDVGVRAPSAIGAPLLILLILAVVAGAARQLWIGLRGEPLKPEQPG